MVVVRVAYTLEQCWHRVPGGTAVAAIEVARELKASHPEVELGVSFDTERSHLAVVVEATIEQAIRNVLDNAAQATLANGGRRVDVAIRVAGTRLTLAVTDQGAGLDPAVRDDVGLRAVVSTKEHGLGVGLLLSRAALQRFGGRLDLKDAPLVIKQLDNAESVTERQLIENIYGVSLRDCQVQIYETKIPMDAKTFNGRKTPPPEMKPGSKFWIGFMIDDNDQPGTDYQSFFTWTMTYGTFSPKESGAIVELEP